MKARAALIAPLLLLAVPATAQASAFIDVNCDRVRIDYHQWESGPPDSSHTSVRVDGGIRFDEVVSFPGSTFRVEVPLNLNDGKPHTIEVKHDWVNHEEGSKEVDATLTCGSPPPADQPAPPEQPPAPQQPAPVSPPPPAAPATPTAAGGTPTAPSGVPVARPRSTAEHAAQRRKARRQRQRAEARRERQRARHRATSHRAPRNPG